MAVNSRAESKDCPAGRRRPSHAPLEAGSLGNVLPVDYIVTARAAFALDTVALRVDARRKITHDEGEL
jgi:hypothetical protein